MVVDPAAVQAPVVVAPVAQVGRVLGPPVLHVGEGGARAALPPHPGSGAGDGPALVADPLGQTAPWSLGQHPGYLLPVMEYSHGHNCVFGA